MTHNPTSLFLSIELQDLHTQFNEEDWKQFLFGIHKQGSHAFFVVLSALPPTILQPLMHNIRKIIQKRESQQEEKKQCQKSLDILPSDIKRHIASFSDAQSYFRLSVGNRGMYLALLRTITLIQIEVPYVISLDLAKYTKLRKLNLGYNQISTLKIGKNLQQITHLHLNSSEWTYSSNISIYTIFDFIRKCKELTHLSIYFPMNIPIVSFAYGMPSHIRSISIFKTPLKIKQTLLRMYAQQLVEITVYCAHQSLSLGETHFFHELKTLRFYEMQIENNICDIINFIDKSPKLCTIFLDGIWNMTNSFSIWDIVCHRLIAHKLRIDLKIFICYLYFKNICTEFTNSIIKQISGATHNHPPMITIIVDISNYSSAQILCNGLSNSDFVMQDYLRPAFDILDKTLSGLNDIDKPWLNIQFYCATDVTPYVSPEFVQNMTNLFASLSSVSIIFVTKV